MAVVVGVKGVGGQLLYECDTIERERRYLGIWRSSVHRAVCSWKDRIRCTRTQCDARYSTFINAFDE